MNRTPQQWWKSIMRDTLTELSWSESTPTLQKNMKRSSRIKATLFSRHMRAGGKPYRMRWQDSICVVPPPQTQTVKKTNSRVVENIIWRAYVAVSLMDRAKVIAPRRPGEHNKQNDQHTCTQWAPRDPMSPWRLKFNTTFLEINMFSC